MCFGALQLKSHSESVHWPENVTVTQTHHSKKSYHSTRTTMTSCRWRKSVRLSSLQPASIKATSTVTYIVAKSTKSVPDPNQIDRWNRIVKMSKFIAWNECADGSLADPDNDGKNNNNQLVESWTLSFSVYCSPSTVWSRTKALLEGPLPFDIRTQPDDYWTVIKSLFPSALHFFVWSHLHSLQEPRGDPLSEQFYRNRTIMFWVIMTFIGFLALFLLLTSVSSAIAALGNRLRQDAQVRQR